MNHGLWRWLALFAVVDDLRQLIPVSRYLGFPFDAQLSDRGLIIDCEHKGRFDERLISLIDSYDVYVNRNLDLWWKLSIRCPVAFPRNIRELNGYSKQRGIDN